MKNGRHRNNSGDVFIVKNGRLHCEDGPAIVWSDGTKEWYLNGKRHREGGPAIERSEGALFWYLNGKQHREDGPAIIWSKSFEEWYLNGVEVSKDEFDRHLERKNHIASLQFDFALKRTSVGRKK